MPRWKEQGQDRQNEGLLPPVSRGRRKTLNRRVKKRQGKSAIRPLRRNQYGNLRAGKDGPELVAKTTADDAKKEGSSSKKGGDYRKHLNSMKLERGSKVPWGPSALVHRHLWRVSAGKKKTNLFQPTKTKNEKSKDQSGPTKSSANKGGSQFLGIRMPGRGKNQRKES